MSCQCHHHEEVHEHTHGDSHGHTHHEHTHHEHTHKGHCCCCGNEHDEEEEGSGGFLHDYWKMMVSALLLFSGLILNATDVTFFQTEGVAFVWYLLAYLPVGLPVLKEVWESFRAKDYFNEFALMFIASIGAFYIGEYPEGVAVMLFYSLGELFQDKAVGKAKRSIRALLDVRPETANVVRHGSTVTESPRNVQTGETIEVKAGERVPLDGIMLSESAAFNTSALTGESLPRTLHKGEEVLAGMIVTDKVVHVQVTRPFEESALSRILELVQNASERKAPAELFIRKFARIYTPIVTGLACLVVLLPYLWSLVNPTFAFVFNDWLYRALVFLVLSCPCALVVSIPLGYFGGIGAASRLGVLFKGGNFLDAITQVNTVVFDKTGTLTQGTFDVQSCQAEAGMTEERLIKLTASLERNSTHPIAKAITEYAKQRCIEPLDTDEVTEIAGHGLTADIEGRQVLVGNTRLLDKYGVDYPARLASVTDTLVVCAEGGRYVGCFLLADTLKKDALDAIEALKALNIKNIQILSGDKQAIVTTFAQRLGISQAYGDLLPDGKVKHIEALRQDATNRIAFVGDGINDAPVLALSHVGIAMGGLGSDAAIETADVVIQTDQPSRVATAIRAGRLTRRIVWQNIALAFGVKLLVLILGAAGMANLWEAVFADVGVALIAIVNAMRIGRMIG